MRQEHRRSVDVPIEHPVARRHFVDQRLDVQLGAAQRTAQIDVDAEFARAGRIAQPRVQLVVQLLIGRGDAERIEARIADEPVGDRRSPTHRADSSNPSSRSPRRAAARARRFFVSSVITAAVQEHVDVQHPFR